MQKRRGGKFTVDDYVINKARAQVLPHSSQQALPCGIFAVARPIGLDVRGQDKIATNHRPQNEMMAIAKDFFFGIAIGATQRTSLLSSPSSGRAIDGQTHKTAIFKSLVALGAVEHHRQSGPSRCRI